MSNLYEFSKLIRRGFFIFCIFIFGYFFFDVFNFLFESSSNSNTILEEKRFYMLVDRAFGELEAPNIEPILFTGTPIYQIQGFHVLKDFPDVSYVYKVARPKGELGKIEIVRDLVSKVLGFDLQTEKKTLNIYSWTKDSETKKITFDLEKNKWELTTKFFSNETAIADKKNVEISKYSSSFQSLISRMKFEDMGLDSAEIKSNYLRINVSEDFENVSRQFESDFVQVDAYRVLDLADLKPADIMPKLEEGETLPKKKTAIVYYSDPKIGQVSSIVGNSLSDVTKDLFTLSHSKIENSLNSLGEIEKASYKIITPDEAWNNILLGKGHLTSLTPQDYYINKGKIQNLEVENFIADATRTELAFWQESEYTKGYILPIYVFRGSAKLKDGRIASFVYYIDAIKRI